MSTSAETAYVPFNQSLYEYVRSRTTSLHEETALTFYGKKISYDELFAKIDEVENALKAFGIQQGDHILVSLVGTPEAIYILYAINKIGAIYCAMDCRSRPEEIQESIKTFRPKLCFACDFHLTAFKGMTSVPVVCVPPAYSVMGKMSETNGWFRKVWVHQKNILFYRTFLKADPNAIAKLDLPTETKRTENGQDIFGYFYTSGTTYGRKSVILTNDNINAAASRFQGAFNQVITIGGRFLNMMPLFTCYSVTIGTHLPLSVGVTVSLVPLINTKKLKQLILKEKPNYMISVPAHWEYFSREKFDGEDLSFLKLVVVGGDKVDPDYEDLVNSIFKACNSDVRLSIGYGLSETTSCTTAPYKSNSPKGGVGQTFEHIRVKIVDTETGKEVATGEVGEICISGPTVCKGYYNDPTATQNLLHTHDDGIVWLHSGDRGYVDAEGNVFFCERIKRMYVRYDGTKVSPYSIEQVLCKCPQVKQCMVVPEKDTAHSHGMCARALIVLNDDAKKNVAASTLHIKEYIHFNLGIHMRPAHIDILEKLPYTKNGKLDYFSSTNTTTEQK